MKLKLEQLSISMEEGTVISWLAHDGDTVSAGDEIAEVETDKATVPIEAPTGGVLHIVAQVGERVSVGAVLADIVDHGGEDHPKEAEQTPGASRGSGAVSVGEDSSSRGFAPAATEATVMASPAARELARKNGVDLGSVQGSGPNGRILLSDVEQAAAHSKLPSSPSRRQAVVRALIESWHQAPHIHVGGQLAAEGLLAAKAALRADGQNATITDLLVFAMGRAMTVVPELNGTYRDGITKLSRSVNIGLAIASDDGVVAPVIKDVDRRNPREIVVERTRLVERAREGQLEKRDFGSATCTLSNLGAYPVDFFAPIIASPQIALVATGRVSPVAAAAGSAVSIQQRIWVNVAIDHRAADGEAGGRFLRSLEEAFANLPLAAAA